MTDRLSGFIVSLEHPTRDDDAEPIRQAIAMIKGVIAVSPVVSNTTEWLAKTQVQHELRQKILDILWPKEDT